MSRRLHVSEVRADRFGKWTDKTLSLPDDPFVVVFGQNESGKSTLAELLVWLLVGADDRKAADLVHLGTPGDILKGSVAGTLDGNPFHTVGEFRLLKVGAPNTTFHADTGAGHDLASWRHLLGGVDPAVMRAVYRLWGTDLHDVGDLAGQLSRLALGSLGGSIDPRTVVTDLRELARSKSKAAGAQDTSVITVKRQIDEVRKERNAALGNAELHARITEELRQVSLLVDQQATDLAAAEEQVQLAERATAAVHARRAAAHARAHRDALPEVPPAWQGPAAEHLALAGLESELAAQQPALDLAEREAHTLAGGLGTTPEALALHTITDADATHVARLAERLAAEQSSRALAREQERAAIGRHDTAVAQTAHAAAHLPGADRRALEQVRLDEAARSHLAKVQAQLEAAAAARAQADLAARTSSEEYERAARHAATARERWDSFGIHQDPEPWIYRSAEPAPAALPLPSPPAPGSAWWALVIALAVAGAAAIALGQPIGGVAGFAAAAAVWFATLGPGAARRPHADPPASPAGPGSTQTHHALLRAALAAKDSADALARAGAQREQTAADLSHRCLALADAEELVRSSAAKHGVTLGADPAAFGAELQRWNELHARFRDEMEAHQARADATAAVERANAAVGEVRSEIVQALDQLGVPQPADLASSADVVTQHRAAATAAQLAVRLAGEQRARAEQFDTIVAPVAAEVQGWSRARIVDQATAMAASLAQRAQADTELRDADLVVQAKVGDDDSLRAILDARPSDADLARRLAEAQRIRDDRKRDHEQARQHAWDLDRTLTELAQVDRVAGLQAELGGLQEQQQELALEAAAAAAAAALLESVAEEYRRANQPAVVSETRELALRVCPDWEDLSVRPGASPGDLELLVRMAGGREVPSTRLSTGAKGLLHLALRLAMANHDETVRGWALPLICDDPMVHFDDDRAARSVELFQVASQRRQVILFTCHERTVETALDGGATLVKLV